MKQYLRDCLIVLGVSLYVTLGVIGVYILYVYRFKNVLS